MQDRFIQGAKITFFEMWSFIVNIILNTWNFTNLLCLGFPFQVYKCHKNKFTGKTKS